MKSKRIFSFAIVLLLIAVCCAFSLDTIQSVNARRAGLLKAIGYEYTIEYLLQDANYQKLEGQTSYIGGRTVKYSLTEAGYAESTEQTAGSTVTFKKKGVYEFKVYKTADNSLEGSFYVETLTNSEITADSLSYGITTEAINAYKTKINTVLTPAEGEGNALKVGDSFSIPSLEGLASSSVFDYTSLTKNIYYTTPQTTVYTSTTSSKFTLTTPGRYSFYILLSDEIGNRMSLDKCVECADGWYEDADEDGVSDGAMVCPIFSFTVEGINAPKIAVGTSEIGFIDLEYKISNFTITATNYDSEYKLYYSQTMFDKADEVYATEADFIKAVKDDPTTVDVTETLFDADDKTFTPDKTGYYYALLRVVDSANLSDEAMSKAIAVNGGYTTIKVENEFFKNNLVSIIFASISVVLVIAIVIVIITMKPADYDVQLDVKPVQKKKSTK